MFANCLRLMCLDVCLGFDGCGVLLICLICCWWLGVSLILLVQLTLLGFGMLRDFRGWINFG